MDTAGSEELMTAAPSDMGVEVQGIEALLDSLESIQGVEMHSLMILRHGYVIAAGWWWPYARDQLQLLYSVSKSFTSTAVGLAADEGLINLDDPVITYFPELEDEVDDPRSRSMRIRDLLAMASGHLDDTWPKVLASDVGNPVRGFLRLPPESEPGSIFRYNQSATYALAVIVQRVTQQTLTQYLRRGVLDPLGAGRVAWWQHPHGQDLGFSGLHATTDTVARLGQLYLAEGSWRGRQLVSPEWISQASSEQISTRTDDPAAATGADSQRGYGFQFWKSRFGYRADGAYGQFCLVLPQYDAVVAMTSECTQTQDALDAVWNHLVPAFRSAPLAADPVGTRRLEERLANLALAPLQARLEPPAGEAGWMDASFRPVRESCREQPTITGVRIGPRDRGWLLVIEEEDWTLEWRVTEGWSHCVSEGVVQPIVASGGWSQPELLRISMIFVESPHRLELHCSLDDGVVSASWVTLPLHPGSLRDLRVERHSPVTWFEPVE